MDVKRYYKIYTDVWKFFRKYAEQLPLSDSQWNEACREMIDICEQYKGDMAKFVSGIMYQTMMELERCDKAAKIAKM